MGSKNPWLPKYNGVNGVIDARYKANFLRLKRAVFLVGSFTDTEFDDGIEPWQSGNVGFYKTGTNTSFVGWKQEDVYINDRFGLKTMDQDGRLTIEAPPGVHHSAWNRDEDVVRKYVLPWLD